MRKWFLIMAAALVLCSACGKKDTSVNGVTQEAQASSTEAESLYKEGAGYVGEEDYESAIESLLKCIELDPNYSKAYIQLSKAYIGNEEYDEAEAILKQGYEKTKDPSLEKEQENCIRSICQALTDNEDYETAIPWLLKLQEIDGLRQQIDRLEREIARLQGGAVCPFCGAAARSGDVFCRECGQKL